MLFEPDRHERLTETLWDEDRVRAVLDRILDDTHNAYSGVEKLWPIHSFDVSDERPDVLLPLYYGAAGVVWALHYLNAARRDYLPAVTTLLERNRANDLRLSGEHRYGFAIGDAGILLLHWQLAPSEDLAEQLYSAIVANFRHPSNGFTWGAPGTMRAALFLHEKTGGERWADLFRRNAEILWREWTYREANGCHLWTNDLYGQKAEQLGALHGFAGNAFVLLSGKHLLSQAQQNELVDHARQTLRRTALREKGLANWELCARPSDHPGMTSMRVQHCTGAPGMVNTLSLLPRDAETDRLLLEASELIWTAGPLVKMPSLCHGVPGNGTAFLKLYERTGDAKWLARARVFAMHAIEQNERITRQCGQRKFSLWTGDLGLAVYLHDCIRAKAAIPMLDVF